MKRLKLVVGVLLVSLVLSACGTSYSTCAGVDGGMPSRHSR